MPGEEVVILATQLLVKNLIGVAFTEMAKAGMTDEEQQELFEQEKAKFLANEPEDLPEVN